MEADVGRIAGRRRHIRDVIEGSGIVAAVEVGFDRDDALAEL